MSNAYDEHSRTIWRGKAAPYAASYAHLCGHPVPDLLDALGVSTGDKLLDVGCGSGTVAHLATARGATVTAIDAEPSMVDATRLRVPTATVGLATLPMLPFADATFDAVTANFVINHVGDPLRSTCELARVTRVGGRIGVTVWPPTLTPLRQLWDDVVRGSGITVPDPPQIDEAGDFARTVDGLTHLLEKAGLSEVECAVLEWEHRVDPEMWWAGPAGGIGHLGYILAAQSEATVTEMKGLYDVLSADYLDDDGLLRLPTDALLAVGRRR